MPDQESVSVEMEPGAKQQQATNRWQWISVVGIGTFLLPGFVYWMMSESRESRKFYQEKLLISLDVGAKADAKLADASDDTTKMLGRVADELDDFSDAAIQQGTRIDRMLDVITAPPKVEVIVPPATVSPVPPDQ